MFTRILLNNINGIGMLSVALKILKATFLLFHYSVYLLKHPVSKHPHKQQVVSYSMNNISC